MNRINHTACYIWPTMLHISCALINSSTLKTSSISTNSWGPELFKTLQETSYILLGVQINFPFMIHLIPTWYFKSFLTHHPYDNIINIKVHKYFANIIGLIAHNLSKKGVLTGSTQQRSTWVQYFRTKTLQVRSDSTEYKLNPIQFLIYYNVTICIKSYCYILMRCLN